MKRLPAWMKRLREYEKLRKAVDTDRLPAALTGLSHIHKALLLAAITQDTGRSALVVTADEGEATRLAEDLTALGQRVLLFPYRDFIFRSIDVKSREYEHRRLGTLSHMLEGDFDVCLCAVDAAMEYTLPPDVLYQHCFTLRVGESAGEDQVVEQLLAAGYTRAAQVEGPGQFALRGGILDLFPPQRKCPVRMEFWGEEIDSMAEFDVESQRRGDTLETLEVTPATEILYPSYEALATGIEAVLHGKRKISDLAREKLFADIDSLRSGVAVADDRYLRLVYPEPGTVFDYAAGSLLFVSEMSKLRERMKNLQWQQGEDVKQLLEEGFLYDGRLTFTMDDADFTAALEEGGAVFLETFMGGSYPTKIRETADFQLKQFSLWGGSLPVLTEDLQTMGKDHTTVILAGEEKAAKVLAESLNREGFPAVYAADPGGEAAAGIFVSPGGLSAGFEIPDLGLTVISQGRATAAKKPRRKRPKDAKEIGSIQELKPGDYVVHVSHGIGVFEGIQQLTADGITKDYIKIRYAGKDVLYLPVTQLDLVSKYIGAATEEGTLRLHKLGGEQWQKTKTRVRKAVKEMAKELIALYAKRMNSPGHAFSEDTDLQNDFERRFPYEETEDQLRCADEIKGDMERAYPMDRLLCGDVGFGKTEVALRAAFKCISEGKQCALLVPTTILAWQHYQTAMRRMEGFPLKIGLLSRFRSRQQQEQTITALRRGEVDMVIGTHRLISKDVRFKDLGLVIIDEEQRFGVAQKEKLKQLYPTVDVLTLSATPIPRTLNMAMSGLRDMSSLDEAPGDRHPVQTYVLEQNNGILLDAIQKELRRGGQVYYLHNRVENIDACAARWQILLPEARVSVAHGKMSEEELSSIWQRLLEHEIDLLVCTTIIETGVDVANVNTLIIEDADRMGLAQLHQLRGRVGRSSRRAYAYLCYRQGKALSDIATKRLEAIREYTEFGSGFKIAMRDLEIRGAGNILGGEQHGNMESVGYDMYLKLLNDAVAEEKGEPAVSQVECVVDLPVQAHINESYIEDLPQRLGIYRRIADIRSSDDADDVVDELIDRFGEPPKAVMGLIEVALLRNRAAAQGITEINQRENHVNLYLTALTPEATKVCAALKGRVLLNAGNRPYLSVRKAPGQQILDALTEVLNVMEDSDS